jgi:hypothetical protein
VGGDETIVSTTFLIGTTTIDPVAYHDRYPVLGMLSAIGCGLYNLSFPGKNIQIFKENNSVPDKICFFLNYTFTVANRDERPATRIPHSFGCFQRFQLELEHARNRPLKPFERQSRVVW